MRRPLSHNCLEPSRSMVGSVVDRPTSSRPSKIPAFNVGPKVPVDNGNALPIKLVGRVVYATKIAESVVSSIMVKVVNHIGLLTVGKKPANTMSHVDTAFMLDSQVAVPSVPPSNPAFGFSGYVGQFTRARVIADVISNRIRDNLASHIAPPCGLVRGLTVAAVSASILSGCATKLGNNRQAQHSADQIKMVAIQREARLQEKQAEAEMNVALVEALARVAEANPEHAPSVSVALAVIGVRGADTSSDEAPTVTLQQQQNVGLEYVKALAPTVGGLVTGLGVAAIQADVTKTQSDNSRAVQESSNETSARIVESVAAVGVANAGRLGVQVAGDYLQVSDNGVVDQSVNTSETNSTVTTSTVSDSYNEGSYNSTSTDTSTETQNTSTNTITMSTALTYGGSQMTLADLIAQLQAAGASYSIDLDGDGVPDVSEDNGGTTVTIDCRFAFSPQPAECS